MPKKKKATCFHVVLIGDKNVGKHSLREQFVKGWIAPKDFQAPPGTESKTLLIEKDRVEITVSCLKQLESTEELTNCSGIVLVYNISEKSSLEYIRNQAEPFLRGLSSTKGETADPANGEPQGASGETKLNDMPLVLVGNKADEAKLSRNTAMEDGEQLSSELKCVGFFETSATCNENVQKSFLCLAEKMLEMHRAENHEIPGAGKRKKSKCVIS